MSANPQPGGRLNNKTCGGHSTGETPSTIPNLEAKPGSANGTATDRLWESRTPPQHTKQADRETPTREGRPGPPTCVDAGKSARRADATGALWQRV